MKTISQFTYFGVQPLPHLNRVIENASRYELLSTTLKAQITKSEQSRQKSGK